MRGSFANSHVYSVCFFQAHRDSPDVELVDAEDDEEIVASTRHRRTCCRREIWEHHRLVAVLPGLDT